MGVGANTGEPCAIEPECRDGDGKCLSENPRTAALLPPPGSACVSSVQRRAGPSVHPCHGRPGARPSCRQRCASTRMRLSGHDLQWPSGRTARGAHVVDATQPQAGSKSCRLQPPGRARGTLCQVKQAGHRGTVLHGSTHVRTWSDPARSSREARRQGAAELWPRSRARGRPGPAGGLGQRGGEVCGPRRDSTCNRSRPTDRFLTVGQRHGRNPADPLQRESLTSVCSYRCSRHHGLILEHCQPPKKACGV